MKRRRDTFAHKLHSTYESVEMKHYLIFSESFSGHFTSYSTVNSVNSETYSFLFLECNLTSFRLKIGFTKNWIIPTSFTIHWRVSKAFVKDSLGVW